MRGLTTQPAQLQPSGKGMFVVCLKSVAIIVFIRLVLLAYGDKQRSGAAKACKSMYTAQCAHERVPNGDHWDDHGPVPAGESDEFAGSATLADGGRRDYSP